MDAAAARSRFGADRRRNGAGGLSGAQAPHRSAHRKASQDTSVSKRGWSKFIPLYYAPDIDQSWDVNPGVCNFIAGYVPTKRGTLASYACGPTQVMTDTTTWTKA